jgi:lipopolysaccharide export system protein LptA
MTGKLFLILFILAFFASAASVAQDRIELKKSDKLTGKVIDGKSVREANGNVHFVQGNVNVYCDDAVQYIDDNKIELRGNVKMFQDTLSLFTSKAIYYGGDRRAICEGTVTLKDPNATLRANSGVYYFNEAKAHFIGDVIIVNPAYRILSDELTYFRNTEDSFAKGNVVATNDSAVIKAENIDMFKRQGKTFAYKNVSLESDSSIIYSDTLTDYSNEKKSIASGNVKILNLRNNLLVKGNYAENYDMTKYSFVKGNASLVQVEKEKDTLYIYSNILETFRQKLEMYKAKENAEIIRGNFIAKSDTAIFSKTPVDSLDVISLFPNPVIWQDNLQLTADSVYAEILNNKISFLFAKKIEGLAGSKNSFMILANDDEYFADRYDQVTGNDIKIIFSNDSVRSVDVFKESRSLYFAYDDKKANGVNLSEGENMFITFRESKVIKIKVDKNPKGQYVPENKMKEVQLRLPGFNLREDKPVKRAVSN